MSSSPAGDGIMADIVLRQRLCGWSQCGELFFICRSCDRGRRYCRRQCRDLARREQCRRANRRHQQSVEGRKDHRDRQRAYRERKRRSVTDQGRQAESSSATLPGMPSAALSMPGRPRGAPSEASHDRVPFHFPHRGRPVCARCGRAGRFIDPFGGG
jgi:hypothetical protein